jgi:hypothetical protein
MKKRFSISKSLMQKVTQLAEIHMKRFEAEPDFGNSRISKVYPLLDIRGRRDTLFEVKFSTPDEPDHGYVIVSTSEDYLPVLKFAFHGLTNIERLKSKVGNWAFNPVYFTPLYLVAEDDRGRYITAIGSPPVDLRDKGKSSGPKQGRESRTANASYESFKQQFLKRTFPVPKERKTLIKKAWARIKKSPFIDPNDIPAHNYQTVTAKNYESIPRYYQLLENEGANTHDFATGCVANAWMGLIGYFDNTTTPDVLRGTHSGNSYSLNDYQERVMVALSEYLGTYQGDEEPPYGHAGLVDWEHTKKGYDFIKTYLKRDIGYSAAKKESGMPVLQIIYDYLCSYETPSVAGINLGGDVGHAVIAYEVKANWDDASEDHFVRVYTGDRDDSLRSFAEDPYIAFEDLYEVCALSWIDTGTEVPLPWKSLNVPAFGDLGGRLVMAFRMDTGHIGLAYSSDGKNFQLTSDIISNGKGAPSIAVEPGGKYFYVAWSDQTGAPAQPRLRLAKISPNNQVEELPAPPAPESDGGVSPSIALLSGNLYYLWPSQYYFGMTNIACSPVDALERSGRPWPSSVDASYVPRGAFWKALPIGMIGQPSLVSDGDFLYCGYVTYTGYDFEARIAGMFSSGDVILDKDFFKVSRDAGVSLCFFNPTRTIYASIDSEIQWVWKRFPPNPPASWCLESKAILFPYIETGSIERVVLGSYESMNIGPCLLSAWVGSDEYLHIRYHSEDRPNGAHLDYTGWPLNGSAWPDF